MPFYNTLAISAYKILGKFSKFDAWNKFTFLLENQFNDTKDLEKIQWKKLKKILLHAYENVPLYREKWDREGIKPDDIQKPSDMLCLPITTKDELKENFPEKCSAKNLDKKDWTVVRSSGTTGKPLAIYIDMDCYNHQYADLLYSYYLDGWQLGDKMAAVRNKAHGDYKGKFCEDGLQSEPHSFIRDIVYLFFHRKKLMPPIEKGLLMEEKKLKDAAEKLLNHKPQLLEGNPIYWEILADYLIKNGITIKGIKAIDVDETPVGAKSREKLRKAFGAPVFDNYGSHELGIVSHECESHQGNHILILSNLVEFAIDKKTAQEGELSSIIVTSLNNYATPLIRYDTGDLGRMIKSSCSCKRGFPLMSHIEGRAEDSINVNGKLYTPIFFLEYFQNINEISFFQVISLKDNSYVINLVKNSDIPASLEQKLKNELEGILKGKISIRYVREIETENSGKTRWVKKL